MRGRPARQPRLGSARLGGRASSRAGAAGTILRLLPPSLPSSLPPSFLPSIPRGSRTCPAAAPRPPVLTGVGDGEAVGDLQVVDVRREPELRGGKLNHAYPKRTVLLVGAPREQPPCRETHAHTPRSARPGKGSAGTATPAGLPPSRGPGGGEGPERGTAGRRRAGHLPIWMLLESTPQISPQTTGARKTEICIIFCISRKSRASTKPRKKPFASFSPSLPLSLLLGARSSWVRSRAPRRGASPGGRSGMKPVPEQPPPLRCWSRLRK